MNNNYSVDKINAYKEVNVEFADEEHDALCAHEEWLAERNEISRN